MPLRFPLGGYTKADDTYAQLESAHWFCSQMLSLPNYDRGPETSTVTATKQQTQRTGYGQL